MKKNYAIDIDFYTENVMSTNPKSNALDTGIWFSRNDINTSFLTLIFTNNGEPIDLTDYNISLNWLLANREKAVQELGIMKEETTGVATVSVPTGVISNVKGKYYFTATIEKMDTKETLTSSSYVVTVIDSLENGEIVDDKLLIRVKDSQLLDGKTFEEVAEAAADLVGDIATEGLATKQELQEAVKDKMTNEQVAEAIDEATRDMATTQYVDESIQKIPSPDLSPYLKKEEAATVATSGEYKDLKNVPVVQLSQDVVKFEELTEGIYIFNTKASFIISPTLALEITNIGAELLVFKSVLSKTFMLFDSGKIVVPSGDGVKEILINDMVIHSELDEYATDEELRQALALFKQEETIKDQELTKNIYKYVQELFNQIPETYLIDYATQDFVMNKIGEALADIPSGGLTREEVIQLIDEKIAGISVDLSNYYTKQETENAITSKGYITKMEADGLYMKKEEDLDNYYPAQGQYTSLLKGDFYNLHHTITDLFNTNETNQHENRRIMHFLRKIAGTDRYIVWVDNNGSEHPAGLAVVHFVSGKSLEVDTYTEFTTLGMGVKDNNYNAIRWAVHPSAPIVLFAYQNNSQEFKATLLKINTADWTIEVENEVVLKTGNIILAGTTYMSGDFAITENFDRVGFLFNEGKTDAKNMVFYDIVDSGDSWSFENSMEFPSWTDVDEYNNYQTANMAFLDKSRFLAGEERNQYLILNTIDEETKTISQVKYTFGKGIYRTYSINGVLFNLYDGKDNNYSYMEAFTISDDNKMTILDSLGNYNEPNSAFMKYVPLMQGMNPGGMWSYMPFYVNNWNATESKIDLFTTGMDYAQYKDLYNGTICFNKITKKFEYYYPNFSYYRRQMTDFMCDGDSRAIGIYKNKIYIFEIKKDFVFVVQIGDTSLYSYNCNYNAEQNQLSLYKQQ